MHLGRVRWRVCIKRAESGYGGNAGRILLNINPFHVIQGRQVLPSTPGLEVLSPVAVVTPLRPCADITRLSPLCWLAVPALGRAPLHYLDSSELRLQLSPVSPRFTLRHSKGRGLLYGVLSYLTENALTVTVKQQTYALPLVIRFFFIISCTADNISNAKKIATLMCAAKRILCTWK